MSEHTSDSPYATLGRMPIEMAWGIWIEYLLAKADHNEFEAAQKLKLLTEDLFND